MGAFNIDRLRKTLADSKRDYIKDYSAPLLQLPECSACEDPL